MAYFTIPIDLAATIYIQAPTLPKADAKLQKILGKPLNAVDSRWFPDAPLGCYTLPEVSIAYAMMIRGRTPNAKCEAIDWAAIAEALIPNPEGRKSKVIPRSRDFFSDGNSPVFEADLTVHASAFIKADDVEMANQLFDETNWTTVGWHDLDGWFTAAGFDQEYNYLPVVFSPNLRIIGITPGIELEQVWPDGEEAEYSEPPRKPSLKELERVREIDLVANRLRSHLDALGGGFESLPDIKVHEVAALLIDYKNKRMAESRWPHSNR
ncbi:hypothetical protein [Rhizobium sp. RAF56]|uniref:hypothetical protein n=1 Tax=Rhizobium sp. RAF56 TaxID=3233062 RepID=UPI003F944DE0